MEAIIRLGIRSTVGSIAVIERSETLPDGIFGVDGIETIVQITGSYKASVELLVDKFDLNEKIVTLTAYQQIALSNIGEESDVESLIELIKEAGWSVSVCGDLQKKLKDPAAEVTASSRTSDLTNQKPTIKSLFGLILCIYACTFLIYGWIADWQLLDVKYFYVFVTAIVGGLIGHGVGWHVYRRTLRNSNSL